MTIRTAGARRAALAMTDQWQFCGKNTFNANGAYNAFWQCGGFRQDPELIERACRKDGKWSREAYRLTLAGLALQAELRV